MKDRRDRTRSSQNQRRTEDESIVKEGSVSETGVEVGRDDRETERPVPVPLSVFGESTDWCSGIRINLEEEDLKK